MQAQRRWTESEREFIHEHFRQLTYKQMGEALGRPWTSVRHQASALMLTQGSNLGRKYSTDLDFFAEPNPLNSYWAGFIAADGNVRGKRLKIALGEKDAAHVSRFAADVGYTGPVQHAHGRASVQIACLPYVEHLERHFNITPRKSLTLVPPNIGTEPEVRGFISGVIDGDGCITVNRYRTYVRPRISVYGTRPLLAWIMEHFNRWSPPDARLAASVHRLHGRELHGYSVTARRAVEVGEVLNTVDVPRLARKWDRLAIGQ